MFLLPLLIIALLVLINAQKTHASCGWFEDCNNTNADAVQNSQKKEAIATEANQRRLIKNQPIPPLEKSQERKNLIERLNRFNNENKVSYIYLINYGKVMAFYTIKGKVSSVNSMLTTPDQVVDKDGDQCHYGNAQDCYVVSSPDIDGSYGSNGESIFFFTTDGTYVEWHGDYMLADKPLQMATQPELVRQVQ